MINDVGAHEPIEVRHRDGSVLVWRDGTLSLPWELDRRTKALDLEASSTVSSWCRPTWCCLIGEKGHNLAIVRPADERLIIEWVDRLDLGNGYDPGGVHRLDLREIPTRDDILIIHEVGLARVSAQRIVWQWRHSDATARFERFAGNAVFLASEEGRLAFDLEDVMPVVGEETSLIDTNDTGREHDAIDQGGQGVYNAVMKPGGGPLVHTWSPLKRMARRTDHAGYGTRFLAEGSRELGLRRLPV